MITEASTSEDVSPENRGPPLSISKSTTPNAQTSARRSTGRPAACLSIAGPGATNLLPGLWDAKEFAKQQWAEGCRRGLEKAKPLVSVNDGAAWIWWIIAMCYAPCIEIIDWWHAVEEVWEAAHSLWGQEAPQTQAWVEQAKSLLWTSQLRALMHQVRQVCPRGRPLPDKVATAVGYIFHNRRRMDYAAYREAGYPVGSGSVESACKVVVQERMKQAGMRWSRPSAQAMLALRSILLSERWDAVWAASFKVPIFA